MSIGWIKLHRKLKHWEWFKDVPTCYLFIYLLMEAEYEDIKEKGIIIKRGQLKTSFRKIVSETGLSIQQIRTSLNKLKSTHDITQLSTHDFSLITIENYDKYQDAEMLATQEATQEATYEQHTSNTPIDKEDKELKETNNKKDLIFYEKVKEIKFKNKCWKEAHSHNEDTTPWKLTKEDTDFLRINEIRIIKEGLMSDKIVFK